LTRPARLAAFACARGHVYLHAQDFCPQCQAPLRARSIPPDATLTLDTVVRVSPGGESYVLGIAITHGYDRVVLESEGEVFVARRRRRRARRAWAGVADGRPGGE
jgi:uncharacterized OB-fold protein